MKKKIIFMLQNGIGFGHFKLALTISKYLSEQCEISFITQAKSTQIFDNYNYKIYNFPMLYTLKSNNEILIMNKIINSLIEKIDPDLVIEDTYPEDFYLNLPSLMNVPKILLLNRLSSSEFENFYYNGVLNQYNKIIVLKDKECFINDITSMEVRNYVNYSEKIKYLSGVFNEPTKEVKQHVINKYNINKFNKNIVVSCGAGGWHIGTNICEEIFQKMLKVTNELNEFGQETQIILVLGPYSKYLEDKLKKHITNEKYVKIVDFETDLDALFHVVDLCVLRPGYNSTMEAISGEANVLLLPGISYMEDQEEWCQELETDYGIQYINVNDLSNLKDKVTELITTNKRKYSTVKNNTQKVAEEIYQVASSKSKNKTIRLALNNLNNQAEQFIKYKKEYNIEFVNNNAEMMTINQIPIINTGNFNYKDFNQYNELIIYNDKKFEYERLSYYDGRYHIKNDGHIIIEYEEVVYNNFDNLIKQINAILNNPQKFNDNIIIKIPQLTTQQIEEDIILPLLKYFKENNIIIENLTSYLSSIVDGKISDYKYGYYRPEITKLS